MRLARVGTKKTPCYRIVVADSESPRSGRFIEVVGHYDARNGLGAAVVKKDRVTYWLGKGTQPSEIVRHILKHQSPAAG